MSRPSPAKILPCLLLGSVACNQPSTEAAAEKAARLAGSLTKDAVAVKDKALAPAMPVKPAQPAQLAQPVRQRYVALMNAGAPCAAVPKWSGTRLFEHTSGANEAWGNFQAAGGTMPAPLERFCVYTWAGAGQPMAAPAVPGSVRVDPDPDVVVPQAGSKLGKARTDGLLQALGATPGPQPAVTPYSREEGLAYVAVVDTADSRAPGSVTQPAYGSAPARHQHGLLMGALVQSVRCPHKQAQCTSRQFFAQAFPYDATHVNPLPSGGQRGSLGSLATAVGESVARWKTQPDAGGSPLVINLSLGWDMAHGGALAPTHATLLDVAAPDATVPATVQAVHSAMAWAACEGALSFAASGNAEGALCERQGALAPATWESLPELGAAACARLGVTLAPGQAPAKLAYGVGGLGAGGQPIANGRLGSMPSRALHAHQAAVSVDGGSGTTQPWTGTSISTAGATAIAAQVWSYQPSQRASDVLSTLDAHGASVQLDTAWQSRTAATPSAVHRIDAHSVLAAVDPANNPYAQAQANGAVGSALRGMVDSRLHAPNPLGPVTLQAGEPGEGGCGELSVQPFVAPGTTGGNGLPATSHLTDETRPQPHIPICPNCPVVKKTQPSGGSGSTSNTGAAPILNPNPEYTLHVEIDTRYSTATVDRPVISFFDPASGTNLTVTLGAITVTAAVGIDLHNYTLPSGQTLAAWLDGRGQVVSGRLTLQVDDDGPAGSAPPRTVSQVVDVVR